MWTPLVNGQPFFFQSDSTNYIRAADAAAYLASGGRVSTVWTDRYKNQIAPNGKPKPAAAAGAAAQANPAPNLESANDIGKGLIMSGRSPYIGALMYVGYVLGDFWPFVLFQALVAYALIFLTLRRFGVAKPVNVTAVTLALAATTALPTYDGLLLADAFAAFGILAFLLIASPGRLSRSELVFLSLVLVISTTAHLTHIMILLGMIVALAALNLLKWIPRPPARAWICGIGAALIGYVSVQVTAAVTTYAFGRPPQLLPLLSARFIADGPGKRYIDAGCPGGSDFLICHIPIGAPTSDTAILFGVTPDSGAYMLRSSEERRVMGEQDVAFARAVFQYDPLGETRMIVTNTVRQLLWIDYDGLNQDCFRQPGCWTSLPPTIRDKLRATPSGQGLWPQRWMNLLLYVSVIASLIVLAMTARTIARQDRERWLLLREWLTVGFTGMLVCSFFGGAVADPQYRYQGRLIWLVPFMAGIALLLWLRLRPKFRQASVPLSPAPAANPVVP